MSDLARAINAPSKDTRPFRMGVCIAHTTGAATMQVQLDGSIVTLPCLVGPAYAVNSTVLVARDGKSNGYVLGVLGTAEASYIVPDGTTPTVQQRTTTILPIDQCSFYPNGDTRGVGNIDQINLTGNAATPSKGASYYANQFTALNADVSQPYSATLSYAITSADYSLSTVPHFWLGTDQSREPSNMIIAPVLHEDFTGSSSAVNSVVSVSLPAPWTADLLSGTRGSIVMYEPTNQCDVVFADSFLTAASFAITITYYA